MYLFGIGVLEPYVELGKGVGVELVCFETAFCVLLGLLGVVCAAGGEDAFIGCRGRHCCAGAGAGAVSWTVVEGHAR